MKFKFLTIFLLLFIFSCSNKSIFTLETSDVLKNKVSIKKSYTSSGFTLIYNKSLFKKKIIKKRLNNSKYEILHTFLKPNTFVKIYNPTNSKYIVAKVKYKTTIPKIYNSVITNKIAEILEIDPLEPFIEILEIKNNDKFIAKKAKTFDEEKKVANTAPVTDINVKIISSTDNTSLKKKNTIYFIKISDFYYKNSAYSLIDNLKNKLKMKSIKIKKINENKFRVFSGPYNSFNLMKDDYFLILSYGFEHLDITTNN